MISKHKNSPGLCEGSGLQLADTILLTEELMCSNGAVYTRVCANQTNTNKQTPACEITAAPTIFSFNIKYSVPLKCVYNNVGFFTVLQ